MLFSEKQTTYTIHVNDVFIVKNRFYPYPPFSDYKCEFSGDGVDGIFEWRNCTQNHMQGEGASHYEEQVFQFTQSGTFKGTITVQSPYAKPYEIKIEILVVKID